MGIYMQGRDLYPAVVRSIGRFFEARFVDFPNCFAVASTKFEIEAKAERALAAWYEASCKVGLKPPAPSLASAAALGSGEQLIFVRLRSTDCATTPETPANLVPELAGASKQDRR